MAPLGCERYFNELREPSVLGEKIYRGENFRNNFKSRTMNYCVKINWAKRAKLRELRDIMRSFIGKKMKYIHRDNKKVKQAPKSDIH